MFGRVYLKFSLATDFIFYNLHFRRRIFHSCSLKSRKKTIFCRINNVVFNDTGSNLLHNDYKPNRKPLSYRTNDETSRSNSSLTFKCEMLFQMTEQSYFSLFTLTNGFIPMSIKRLLCDFEYKRMSPVKT